MKITRRALYLLCFLVLASISASAVNRIGAPSILPALLRAVIVASLAGAQDWSTVARGPRPWCSSQSGSTWSAG